MTKDKIHKIAVTGGIASGKSTVVAIFEEYGFKTIDTDQIARFVMRRGQYAYREIISRFGKGVLTRKGNIDRKKLAKIVFQCQKERKVLEQITHPPIIKTISKKIDEYKRQGAKAVVIEIPLLYETGLQKNVDIVIVVYCTRKLQLERLVKKYKLSVEEAIARIDSQIPLEEKTRLADYVIDNSRSTKHLRNQVERIIAKIHQKTTIN